MGQLPGIPPQSDLDPNQLLEQRLPFRSVGAVQQRLNTYRSALSPSRFELITKSVDHGRHAARLRSGKSKPIQSLSSPSEEVQRPIGKAGVAG